ncbi:hypothetical protein MGALJ_22450 [Mycobacterium gallinarum]|uniref:Uncharacterized protein n=1 Tax=Mycobacterium gallinarum TaxID=39689 RepID=A0A9W4FF23_9MYCO|nr:hypothetical protein MGALJ_22450 [Mycobacterium gallinarum]
MKCRTQQLMQARKAERRLRLAAGRPHHRHIAGARHGVLQERGFTDPGFAPQNKHTALTKSRRGEQLPDALLL